MNLRPRYTRIASPYLTAAVSRGVGAWRSGTPVAGDSVTPWQAGLPRYLVALPRQPVAPAPTLDVNLTVATPNLTEDIKGREAPVTAAVIVSAFVGDYVYVHIRRPASS